MQMKEKQSLELSVIMPCRNEENTAEKSVKDAYDFLQKYHIEGEVLVVDNASTDASERRASDAGAHVVKEPKKGYGRALRTGIENSRGRVIIMGDCDTTYDFRNMDSMYQMLVNNQCDVVIGNRFAGEFEPGSISVIHKWGVRFLSFLGRKRFHCDVYDFHCGMRGMTRRAAEKMVFRTDGMEFATEMIAVTVENGLRIQQIPINLRTCTYKRKSKLRTIRDGLRHLIYIIKPFN